MKIILPAEATQDSEPLPQYKLALERHNKELAKQAEVRQTTCWMKTATGCDGNPTRHVHEVGFDFRDIDATQHIAMISSKGYQGPVPGFCYGCIEKGPALLAEMIYKHKPEIRWGMKPSRWVVTFTDGSKTNGSFASLDLHRAQFTSHDSPT